MGFALSLHLHKMFIQSYIQVTDESYIIVSSSI
jgi:hypothetical protein